MDELIKNVDVKEMGRRFKLVRQRLGLTQTEVANELDVLFPFCLSGGASG